MAVNFYIALPLTVIREDSFISLVYGGNWHFVVCS